MRRNGWVVPPQSSAAPRSPSAFVAPRPALALESHAAERAEASQGEQGTCRGEIHLQGPEGQGGPRRAGERRSCPHCRSAAPDTPAGYAAKAVAKLGKAGQNVSLGSKQGAAAAARTAPALSLRVVFGSAPRPIGSPPGSAVVVLNFMRILKQVEQGLIMALPGGTRRGGAGSDEAGHPGPGRAGPRT